MGAGTDAHTGEQRGHSVAKRDPEARVTPRSRLPAGEDGMALVEALLVTMMFTVPLLVALGALSELHRGALAATAAAREAGFEAARSDDVVHADRAVDAAVRNAFFDHGIDSASAKVKWTGAPGLARGGVVEVEVAYPVEVLRLPFLGGLTDPRIWVNARHVARIDPYMSRE